MAAILHTGKFPYEVKAIVGDDTLVVSMGEVHIRVGIIKEVAGVSA